MFLAANMLAYAQKTTRFSADPKRGDNTGRGLNYALVSATQAAGIDTVKLRPASFYTLVAPVNALNDSLCVQILDTTKCALGDQIQVVAFAGGASRKLKFAGAWVGTSSFTVGAGKRVTVTGSYHRGSFVQTSTYTQP